MKASYFLPAAGAILLFGCFAVLSSGLSHLPPLLVAGMALTIGGLLGLVRVRDWRVPPLTLCLGVAGIFGYHALLFTAFQKAPIVEANLVNYLWPLLIVLLSPVILPAYRLRVNHVLGGLLGLAGAALIVTGGTLRPDPSAVPGYLLAAAAALTWASYSLLTKRVPPFSSGAVGAFCLISGILALGTCLIQDGTAGFTAIQPADWLRLLLLGVGPTGGAFILWDAALKRGDPRVIGSLAYVTPLLSTLALVAFGQKRMTAVSAVAMCLIIGGAVVGSIGARPPTPSSSR